LFAPDKNKHLNFEGKKLHFRGLLSPLVFAKRQIQFSQMIFRTLSKFACKKENKIFEKLYEENEIFGPIPIKSRFMYGTKSESLLAFKSVLTFPNIILAFIYL
jgi:hypothetical protein